MRAGTAKPSLGVVPVNVLRIPAPTIGDVDAARSRHVGTMAAVRRMAAAIVGELGGLLSGAVSDATSLVASGSRDPGVSSRMAVLRDTLHQAEEVTRQLAILASRDPSTVGPVRLAPVVERQVKDLRHVVGDRVVIRPDLEGDALWISAGPEQVEEILRQLVLNACEAMPDGGTVEVGTQRWTLDFPHAHAHGTLPAGEWAVLEVADHGQGMTAEVYEHLFEPFFTTKRTVGAGLGLASVYGLVSRLGGQVLVASSPGEGSQFSVAFPAIAGRELAREATVTDALLIVDEDDWSRNVTSRILRRAGFGVLEADRADQALELLRGVAGQCVRLVLVEVAAVRGGRGGFCRTLREEHPTLPVVTISTGTEGSLADRRSVLRRPFTAAELISAVAVHLAPGGPACEPPPGRVS